MPAPPPGVCHFPVKKDGRVVYCGEPCPLIDPNTGDNHMFCALHQKELQKHLAKIKAGEQGYTARGKMKIAKVHMYGR